MIQDLVIYIVFMGYALAFMVGIATIFTWVERKQGAIMADRIGANRCYIRLPFTNIKNRGAGSVSRHGRWRQNAPERELYPPHLRPLLL